MELNYKVLIWLGNLSSEVMNVKIILVVIINSWCFGVLICNVLPSF
jgi:hypothetical protein